MDTYLFESLDDTFKTEEDCVRFLTIQRLYEHWVQLSIAKLIRLQRLRACLE